MNPLGATTMAALLVFPEVLLALSSAGASSCMISWAIDTAPPPAPVPFHPHLRAAEAKPSATDVQKPPPAVNPVLLRTGFTLGGQTTQHRVREG